MALDAFQEGIQTSSFGLGDSYDGPLMSAIAGDGAGGYYYLRDSEQIAPALALVLLMLPVVVRNTEEMLKLVPDELREASYALGVPKWKTIVRIVVPTALPGMISGVLLALARVMGETAPVLVLVGYARSINFDPFNGNMASLPLLIYTEWTNPEAAGRLRVWGAALTLILLVAALYIAAAFVNRYLTRNRS